jgi:SpoVK/Ycf46/Vps4 family AAA+-type ATPase
MSTAASLLQTPLHNDDFALLSAELADLDMLLRRRFAAGVDLPAQMLAGAPAPAVSRDHAAPLTDIDVTDDTLRLPRLARMFGLTPLERAALVVCLAPALRADYGERYARLRGDANRHASVDLVLKVLCDSEIERWAAHAIFSDASPLMRWQLVSRHDDGGSIGALTDRLSVDPRITAFLLGDDRPDARLHDYAALLEPHPELLPTDSQLRATANLLHDWAFSEDPCPPTAAPVIYLHDPAGAGTAEVATCLAGAAALSLLGADTHALLAGAEQSGSTLVRLLCREALLQDAAVYLSDADALSSPSARPVFNALRTAVADAGRPLLLGGSGYWTAPQAFGKSVFTTLTVTHPDIEHRRALWRRELSGGEPRDGSWSDNLAARFVLSARQIRNAAHLARQTPTQHDESDTDTPTLDDLGSACRAVSDQDVGQLAVKVDIRRGWSDLVLPDDKTAALHEICDQIRFRHVVYDQWGYHRRLGHAKGVTVLFSGPPGTGKTVAAQVLAGQAGLALYKIDLSGVVSKYIGETEKNLAAIFARARAANAVLFFDEADALFGKRTEVSDAHDRYANIETSYLLTKLEEHDGVVVLASNLRANLDDAFTRRIRCIVEFPFPDAGLRRRIWVSHFPAAAPLSDDVDLDYLAEALPIAGGNISNVAVGAALLAAADGGAITTGHILAAARREYDKLGKLWSAAPPRQEAT